jgi:hypothetical protein
MKEVLERLPDALNKLNNAKIVDHFAVRRIILRVVSVGHLFSCKLYLVACDEVVRSVVWILHPRYATRKLNGK